MRYFMDSEFIERPGSIELISLGLVAEDGREYYAQSCEFAPNQANPWVQTHVLPQLAQCPSHQNSWQHFAYLPFCTVAGCPWSTRERIRDEVLAFIGAEPPEFWGYYCAYDYVLLCWLFGTMMDLPDGWPPRIYDLRQWLDHKGLAHVKQPDEMPHHALSDARWIAQTYQERVRG